MNRKFLKLPKAKGTKEKNNTTNSVDSRNIYKQCNIIRMRPEEHEWLQETKISVVSCILLEMKKTKKLKIKNKIIIVENTCITMNVYSDAY